MASWRRQLAESLGDAMGRTGSWARRYAAGLAATAEVGSWMRRAAQTLDEPGVTGSWDRRLGGTGTTGSWDRRAVEGPPPPPPPPPPVGVPPFEADFQAGAYTVNNVAAALADILAENADWGAYSPSDVVGGVGLVGDGITATRPVLAGDVFDSVGLTLCGRLFIPHGANDGYGLLFELLDLPDYMNERQVTIYAQAVSIDDFIADFATMAGPGGGRHMFAATVGATEIAVSIDGGDVLAVAPPPPAVDATNIGFRLSDLAALEYLDGRPIVAQADLVALSAPPSTPDNTAIPEITGDIVVGAELACSEGEWDYATTFAYQWRRDAANIGGATAAAYTLVSGDLGADIDCVVTATNTLGSASATADAVGPIESASDAGILAAVVFTVAGTTVTIEKQKNVASVTRLLTGKYRIAFTSAVADTNYGVIGSARPQAGQTTDLPMLTTPWSYTGGGNGTRYTTADFDIGTLLVAGASTGVEAGICAVVAFDPALMGAKYAAAAYIINDVLTKDRNVASIANPSTGVYEHTFDAALPDATYGAMTGVRRADTGATDEVFLSSVNASIANFAADKLTTAAGSNQSGTAREAERHAFLAFQADDPPPGTLAAVTFSVAAGVVTIIKQTNVSGVVRDGNGLYTIQFASALADANYGAFGMARRAAGAGNVTMMTPNNNTTAGRATYSTAEVDMVVLTNGTFAAAEIDLATVWIVDPAAM